MRKTNRYKLVDIQRNNEINSNIIDINKNLANTFRSDSIIIKKNKE